MTAFLALVRTDLILFLSDRRSLMISLVLPIAIAAFFGSLTGAPARNRAIEVVLVQQDTSRAGMQVAAALKADPNLRILPMSLAQAEAAVRKGDQEVAIVLPPGFGQAAGAAMFGTGAKPTIRLLHDPLEGARLAMVKGMLTQQVMSVITAEMFSGTAGTELAGNGPRQPKGAAGGGLSMPFTTHDEGLTSGPREHGYNPYAHSFAGMSVQFILFMGIEVGIGILLAQRSGVWNRLLAAPLSQGQLLLARAASAAIIAFVLLCAVFAVAVAAFGVRIASLPGFIGMALCFAMLTAGLGILIAAFGKTPDAARRIAMFVVLIMVMLGGAWMPSFMFPAWLQGVTLAVPTRWAVDGLEAVTWRGLGLVDVLPAMGVQLGFALAFALLAVWKFGRDAR